jgi:mercuric ion binding protein
METKMRALTATLAAAGVLLMAGSVFVADRQVTLAVKNMTCATCGPIVQKSLARVTGVKHVEVSAEKGTATVMFDDTMTSVPKLLDATTSAGYPSRPLDAKG